METRKIFFLISVVLTTSAFFYMLAKKTNIIGTQRISVDKLLQWQKKKKPEIVQLRNYIRQKIPKTRNFSKYQLDTYIQKIITESKENITPTIDNIVKKMKK